MTSAVRFVTAFPSDAGGLALLGRRSGSVRRSAFGRDLLTYLLTHTIKFEDLTPFLRKLWNWSFRIKFEDLTPFLRKLRNWSFRIKFEDLTPFLRKLRNWSFRIKSEDLTPFLRKLRNWSFRIKRVNNDSDIQDIFVKRLKKAHLNYDFTSV